MMDYSMLVSCLSSFSVSTLVLLCILVTQQTRLSQAQEPYGPYSPINGLHRPYGLPGLGNSGYRTYDDYHRYGGIGQRTHDIHPIGHNGHYADAYGNQALNKYNKQQKSDHYGGKTGGYANHHDAKVYHRNRGYGYEKHYMYDKEYSNSKNDGAKAGQSMYFGDHDKANVMKVDSHKNYGQKTVNSPSHGLGHGGSHLGMGHGGLMHNDYVPMVNYDNMVDDHSNEHHIRHNSDIQRHHELDHHSHYTPNHYSSTRQEYVPVIEERHYVGALGHNSHMPGGHMAVQGPIAPLGSGIPYMEQHGDMHGALAFDDMPDHLPSTANEVYMPSGSSSDSNSKSESRSLNNKTNNLDNLTGDINSSSSAAVNQNTPLISTKTSAAVIAPSVFARIGDTYRVNSATHATPAIINTSNGDHYYNS